MVWVKNLYLKTSHSLVNLSEIYKKNTVLPPFETLVFDHKAIEIMVFNILSSSLEIALKKLNLVNPEQFTQVAEADVEK